MPRDFTPVALREMAHILLPTTGTRGVGRQELAALGDPSGHGTRGHGRRHSDLPQEGQEIRSVFQRYAQCAWPCRLSTSLGSLLLLLMALGQQPYARTGQARILWIGVATSWGW